ncbi:unnamed protein product [Vitrella brassicaformis CCMP3155]|uniref:Nephrocystin-4 n=2 Tax=Vitrella brassicaformis TaxID=1169539 RepID=A0A0G4G933_VITBC|nr:unnamed protein product [Vitrella brassicaformis CCMP3155]|eukprot:CEM25332.1 unnamed protein product [Vitrella brassicaformis CCMP3155]
MDGYPSGAPKAKRGHPGRIVTDREKMLIKGWTNRLALNRCVSSPPAANRTTRGQYLTVVEIASITDMQLPTHLNPPSMMGPTQSLLVWLQCSLVHLSSGTFYGRTVATQRTQIKGGRQRGEGQAGAGVGVGPLPPTNEVIQVDVQQSVVFHTNVEDVDSRLLIEIVAQPNDTSPNSTYSEPVSLGWTMLEYLHSPKSRPAAPSASRVLAGTPRLLALSATHAAPSIIDGLPSVATLTTLTYEAPPPSLAPAEVSAPDTAPRIMPPREAMMTLLPADCPYVVGSRLPGLVEDGRKGRVDGKGVLGRVVPCLTCGCSVEDVMLEAGDFRWWDCFLVSLREVHYKMMSGSIDERQADLGPNAVTITQQCIYFGLHNGLHFLTSPSDNALAVHPVGQHQQPQQSLVLQAPSALRLRDVPCDADIAIVYEVVAKVEFEIGGSFQGQPSVPARREHADVRVGWGLIFPFRLPRPLVQAAMTADPHKGILLERSLFHGPGVGVSGHRVWRRPTEMPPLTLSFRLAGEILSKLQQYSIPIELDIDTTEDTEPPSAHLTTPQAPPTPILPPSTLTRGPPAPVIRPPASPSFDEGMKEPWQQQQQQQQLQQPERGEEDRGGDYGVPAPVATAAATERPPYYVGERGALRDSAVQVDSLRPGQAVQQDEWIPEMAPPSLPSHPPQQPPQSPPSTARQLTKDELEQLAAEGGSPFSYLNALLAPRTLPFPSPFSWRKEITDTLQSDSISLHFLALRFKSPHVVPPSHGSTDTARVHLSLRFFCFERRSTAVALVPIDVESRGASPVLYCLRSEGSGEGLLVEFPLRDIERGREGTMVHLALCEYLLKAQMQIELWHSDGGFILASTRLPLHPLIRQQQPTVTHTIEAILFDPLNHHAIGTLALCITNRGRETQQQPPPPLVRTSPPSYVTIRPASLRQEAEERALGTKLVSERARKERRVERLYLERTGHTPARAREGERTDSDLMEVVTALREERKPQLILKQLRDASAATGRPSETRNVVAITGQPSFFYVEVDNSSQADIRCRVTIKPTNTDPPFLSLPEQTYAPPLTQTPLFHLDSDRQKSPSTLQSAAERAFHSAFHGSGMQVVTDPEEWRCLVTERDFPAPPGGRYDVFEREGGGGEAVCVQLKAHEQCAVPIRCLCLCLGEGGVVGEGKEGRCVYEVLIDRLDGALLHDIRVEVAVLPPPVDRTVRHFAREATPIEMDLMLPAPLPRESPFFTSRTNHNTQGPPSQWYAVHCTDSSVALSYPGRSTLHLQIGHIPSRTRGVLAFYLVLYGDKGQLLSGAALVWEILLHVLPHEHLSGTIGQTLTKPLFVPPTSPSLTFFSSLPSLVGVGGRPDAPLIEATPLRTGTHRALIQAMTRPRGGEGGQQGTLRWVVEVESSTPRLSRAYSMSLPLRSPVAIRRRLQYTNTVPAGDDERGGGRPVKYLLRSSDPTLMEVMTGQIVLGAGEEVSIDVVFAPSLALPLPSPILESRNGDAPAVNVFILISCAADEKIKDCRLIRVSYIE